MPPIVTLTMNPALDIATDTERVVPGHKLRCAAPRYDAGGGGINVARAVRALGGEAVAVMPLGGRSGDMIRHLLDREGVAYRPVPITGVTRESLAVEERGSGNQYRFILPGPHLTRREAERCLDALSALLPQSAAIVASGSLPPGVPEDFYARVAALAARAGRRFFLDTSGAALKAAGRGVYLMKPSLRELAELTGSAIETIEEQQRAARAIVAASRAEVVVLSLGADGALLVTADASERFAAIPVSAKSTVGAGDSMLAGIVLMICRGASLSDAVRYGVAAGAAAMLGAGTALCRREDVERLLGLRVAADDRLERQRQRQRDR